MKNYLFILLFITSVFALQSQNKIHSFTDLFSNKKELITYPKFKTQTNKFRFAFINKITSVFTKELNTKFRNNFKDDDLQKSISIAVLINKNGAASLYKTSSKSPYLDISINKAILHLKNILPAKINNKPIDLLLHYNFLFYKKYLVNNNIELGCLVTSNNTDDRSFCGLDDTIYPFKTLHVSQVTELPIINNKKIETTKELVEILKLHIIKKVNFKFLKLQGLDYKKMYLELEINKFGNIKLINISFNQREKGTNYNIIKAKLNNALSKLKIKSAIYKNQFVSIKFGLVFFNNSYAPLELFYKQYINFGPNFIKNKAQTKKEFVSEIRKFFIENFDFKNHKINVYHTSSNCKNPYKYYNLSFSVIINKKGKVSATEVTIRPGDIKIIGLNNAINKVLKKLPKIKPGTKNLEKVNVKFNIGTLKI